MAKKVVRVGDHFWRDRAKKFPLERPRVTPDSIRGREMNAEEKAKYEAFLNSIPNMLGRSV